MKDGGLTFHLADRQLSSKTRFKFFLEWFVLTCISCLITLVGNITISTIYFLLGIGLLEYRYLIREVEVLYLADVVLIEEVPTRKIGGRFYRGFLVRDYCSKFTQVCYEDRYYFNSTKVGELITIRQLRKVRGIRVLKGKI